jgi:hypothetical protein
MKTLGWRKFRCDLRKAMHAGLSGQATMTHDVAAITIRQPKSYVRARGRVRSKKRR